MCCCTHKQTAGSAHDLEVFHTQMIKAESDPDSQRRNHSFYTRVINIFSLKLSTSSSSLSRARWQTELQRENCSSHVTAHRSRQSAATGHWYTDTEGFWPKTTPDPCYSQTGMRLKVEQNLLQRGTKKELSGASVWTHTHTSAPHSQSVNTNRDKCTEFSC